MRTRSRAWAKQFSKLVIWISLLVLIACLAWKWLHDPDYLPIAHVKIRASYNHLDQAELERMVTPFLQQGFYGSSAIKLQAQLSKLQWVEHASFKRVWPDTLIIELIEHEPAVRWGDNGVLDKNGELFFPPEISLLDSLPKLSGPDVLAPKMFAHFYKMQGILRPEALKITAMTVSPRHSWQLRLNNGVTVELGREHQLKRLTRFAKVWPQLVAKHHGMISSVDLRYPNGAAVQ